MLNALISLLDKYIVIRRAKLPSLYQLLFGSNVFILSKTDEHGSGVLIGKDRTQLLKESDEDGRKGFTIKYRMFFRKLKHREIH